MIKILNGYAGLGGNRRLWGNEHKITAIENDEKIAEVYQSHFPNDEVIIGDAHEYLLNNFHKYDFIWYSPPCPSHSDIRRMATDAGSVLPIYPEMSLYQEIILLQTYYKGQWCVENVKPYYKPLIPAQVRDRHCFWANFYIPEFKKTISKHNMPTDKASEMMGFDLSNYKGDKRKILRNCVLPEVGKLILDAAIRQNPQLI